jgi:galactitol-specific phosphotransferase system IIB component
MDNYWVPKHCGYLVLPLRSIKKLEQQVLNTADVIIVTSKTTKSEFEVLTNRPIAVITNGYDNEK